MKALDWSDFSMPAYITCGDVRYVLSDRVSDILTRAAKEKRVVKLVIEEMSWFMVSEGADLLAAPIEVNLLE
jgi:DNA polymerase III delta subunit